MAVLVRIVSGGGYATCACRGCAPLLLFAGTDNAAVTADVHSSPLDSGREFEGGSRHPSGCVREQTAMIGPARVSPELPTWLKRV